MRPARIAVQKPLPYLFLLAMAAMLIAMPPAHAQKWQPIPPEELALKEHPTAPGAPAIVLYRESFTDGGSSAYAFETHYRRIKVLTEEGKKYGDIEIVYDKSSTRVDKIEARTIRPDGSIVEFDGKAFDKLLVRFKGTSFQAKTFTMPAVEIGSIIEYRYRINWTGNTILLGTSWIVQDNLFTRRAVFGYKPILLPTLRPMWVTSQLPRGTQVKEEKNNELRLVLDNIPAFEEESYMPPEDMLKMRVDFFYTSMDKPEPPAEFWKREGKEWHEVVEEFIGKRRGIGAAVGQIVSPTDTPDVKLRKIYARVQQIRNLTFEELKTEKEEKRENLKDNSNVEDVWKRGYGYRSEINRLFVALARAAGLDASVVRIGGRDRVFFNQQLIDARQLNTEVAAVVMDGKERYFDPGTRYCPFGLLSWQRSGVQGLRLNKEGGVFVETTMFDSSNAQVRRKAELELERDGSIRGNLIVSFTGLEALRRRLDNDENDETGKRKALEDEIREWVPSNTRVKLGTVTGWDAADEPLTAEAEVEIPGYAAPTGRRLLLPTAPFQANEKHPFQFASRKYPVYFRHPFQEYDEVALKLPEGLRLDAVPQPTNAKQAFGGYERVLTYDAQARTLTWKRRMSIEGILFRTEYYPMLRSFFNTVRQGDEQSLVLQVAEVGTAR